MNAYGVKSEWSCGWQVKLCDPVNTCHSVALCDCLGRKNALYKYLILYFFYFTLHGNQTLKPLSQLATRHLVVHKAVATYNSSSDILLIYK